MHFGNCFAPDHEWLRKEAGCGTNEKAGKNNRDRTDNAAANGRNDNCFRNDDHRTARAAEPIPQQLPTNSEGKIIGAPSDYDIPVELSGMSFTMKEYLNAENKIEKYWNPMHQFNIAQYPQNYVEEYYSREELSDRTFLVFPSTDRLIIAVDISGMCVGNTKKEEYIKAFDILHFSIAGIQLGDSEQDVTCAFGEGKRVVCSTYIQIAYEFESGGFMYFRFADGKMYYFENALAH